MDIQKILADVVKHAIEPNPILKAARRAALGEKQLLDDEAEGEVEMTTASDMQGIMNRSKAGGAVGKEGRPVASRGNGPRKGITKVDK